MKFLDVRPHRVACALMTLVALVALTVSEVEAQGPPKAPLPVEVVNTPLPVVPTSPIEVVVSSPLSVRDADNPARTPYQTTFRFRCRDICWMNSLEIEAGLLATAIVSRAVQICEYDAGRSSTVVMLETISASP